MRKCPYCESKVSETAKKCKYCGEWLEAKKISNNIKDRNISENSQKKKQTRKYLIIFIPIIILVILLFLPRMKSASPVTIEYAKQIELAQKNNGSLNNNQQNSNCLKIIKEKYGIVDEYAKCTGKTSGQTVMGGDRKELTTKWIDDCVRNLFNNYPKTNSYSYKNLGCDGTGLEVINILDNFYTNFFQCFNQAGLQKAKNSEEAKKIVQDGLNCNDKALEDYVKIIPYVDYLYSL